MIPALVLTAGFATRLRPLSLVRAKAALPVAQETLARRILVRLAAAGVRDAVLNLHHLPATLTGQIGDGSDLGIRVRYSWETPTVLGSAGGPRHALPMLDSSFLIVNGDTLTDVDLEALVDDHRRSGALVTMALVPNVEPLKYGGVDVGPDGSVRGFVRRGSPAPSFHFVGVQVADALAFETLSDGVPFETTTQLYPTLIRTRPESVRAFISAADFMDIGTPADYLATSLVLASREGRHDLRGTACVVEAGANIDRSVLWDHVQVGRGARLDACVVTDGVRVPPGTSWRGVAMRVPDGQLTPGERVVGEIAVTPI